MATHPTVAAPDMQVSFHSGPVARRTVEIQVRIRHRRITRSVRERKEPETDFFLELLTLAIGAGLAATAALICAREWV